MSRHRSSQSSYQSDQSTAHQPISPLQARPFGPSTAPQPENQPTVEGQQPTVTQSEKQPGFKFAELNLFASGTAPPSPPTEPNRLQAKLTIGQPNDQYEQEADQVAQQVVQRINSPQSTPHQDDIQRVPLDISPLMRLPMQHQGGMSVGPVTDEFESRLNRARSGGGALEPTLQAQMGAALGADFSGVRVHTDAQADQLNRAIQAKAFTTGHDVFFRQGEYQPGSRAGQTLIAHELTHVVQQQPKIQTKRTASQPLSDHKQQSIVSRKLQSQSSPSHIIQCSYATASPMAKARIDQQSEEKYAEKTQEFEFKMAPKIMADSYVNANVDGLLSRVRKIVNAWADATGKELAQTYEEEFGWSRGDDYYGAFEMTALNIGKALYDKSQPLRIKLKVVYNAVRNNNLAKWLKLAAIELDRKAKGKTPKDWKIKTATQSVTANGRVVKGRAKKETVKVGFAEQSGLEDWLTPEQVTEFASTAQKEQTTEHSRSKRDVFGHDRFSGVVGWKPETHKANDERRYGASNGLSLDEQRTLQVKDVPDLTDAEIDLLYKRQNKPQPNEQERSNFRNDPNAKIAWGQGGECYDIELGSDSAKAAETVKARMEAGISGSTDLMLHAAQNLGITDVNLLKGLRLALAGWMLANRDHSFYEVYKAAESYGLPFDIDPSNPGKEYESADNLYPMDPENFADTLPEGVFPRYFLSTAYKDELANTLTDGDKTQDSFKTSLRAQGIPDNTLNTLDERATAELSRLSEVVAAANIDVTERMAKEQQSIRRIKQHSSFIYLGNRLGEPGANGLLTALLKTHHSGKGVAPSSNDLTETLADTGIPRLILDKLSTQQIQKLDVVRQAVISANNIQAIDKAFNKLNLGISKDEKQSIKAVLMQTYHGDRALGDEDKVKANDTRFLSQLEVIAQMNKTSGWWYSWGNLGYLGNIANTGSIRQATAGMNFQQGPGFYVAQNAWSSSSYGENQGQGVLAVQFNNVPTISRANAAQMKALQKLTGTTGGDPLEKAGLYESKNVIEMLLIYNTSGSWGRLTTNKGVTVRTFDLSQPPLDALKRDYPRMTDGAKQNFKQQAEHYHVTIESQGSSVNQVPVMSGMGMPPPPPPLSSPPPPPPPPF